MAVRFDNLWTWVCEKWEAGMQSVHVEAKIFIFTKDSFSK